MGTVIETEETALVAEIKEIVSAGYDVTVVCDGDYEMAAEFMKELKDKEKTALEFFAPMVKAAHQAHKEVKARENEIVKPLTEARKAVGAEMGRYQTKKEAERRAEEEKLRIQQQKEADERALGEAVRLEEVARLEKAARIEEAAKLEESGKSEEAARVEEVAKLEEAARLEAAEAVLENIPVVQPIVESVAPKVEGTSVRTTWKYDIVNQWIIPREFLCVDEKAIGAMVRAKKEQASIRGVRVYSVTNVS